MYPNGEVKLPPIDLIGVTRLICGTVDVQRNGGVVAYIHIGNAVIHHHVLEAVTFASPWKREKRERNKIQLGGLGDDSKGIYKERIKMQYCIHGERLIYKGKKWKEYKRGGGEENGHQKRGVWTKGIGGSIAIWKDGGK